MPKRPKAENSSSSGTTQNHQNHSSEVSPSTNHETTPRPPEEDHEHDDITEESEQNARKVKEKKHDAGAADLERVTDFAEETEISASDISAVMGLIGEEVADRLAKEKELLKVKIRKEDVDLLVREFEISEEKAERTLREHVGNLMETLETLTT